MSHMSLFSASNVFKPKSKTTKLAGQVDAWSKAEAPMLKRILVNDPRKETITGVDDVPLFLKVADRSREFGFSAKVLFSLHQRGIDSNR